MKIYSTIFFCCAFFVLSAQNIIKDADCNTNPLSHEFGHNFEDLYCDCKYVDELFEINKNKHFFKHPQTLFNQRL